MRVGILALQGAFAEHEAACRALGATPVLIRQLGALEPSKNAASVAIGQTVPFDALILPGGESTTQGLLLRQLGLFEPLRQLISNGLPTFATCAGLILLTSEEHFGTLPAQVVRNGYGRQLGSFSATLKVGAHENFSARFIRAPYIASVAEGVEILARADERIVGVRYRNQTGYAFHPELGGDLRLHEEFLKSVMDAHNRR